MEMKESSLAIESSEDRVNSMPYYLGLDVGTNSVGWAITDTDYRIIKKAGKALWGVRLFNEAKTAAERRMFRTARRRRKRAKTRIRLLQEIFAPAISDIDPGFFQRLKDSFLYADDKAVNQKHALFADPEFNDLDYYQKYPTIYHLRRELMEDPTPHDVRLIYLACHHIMKNRGNFLYAGAEISTSGQFEKSFIELIDVGESFDLSLWTPDNQHDVQEILANTRLSGRDKEKALSALINDVSPSAKEISKLLVGNTARMDILFENDDLKESEVNKLSFEDDYDLCRDALEGAIGASIEVVDAAHELYTAVLLQRILGSGTGTHTHSISDARVAIYEKHQRDLVRLKSVIHKIDRLSLSNGASPHFRSMFRANAKGLNNYVAYSGHVDSADTSSPITRCTRVHFYKYTREILNGHADEPDVSSILQEMESGLFMPKILSSGNGIVPQQLHMQELKQILTNASHYLPFLNTETIEKITQIFTFRIPYYIGPFDNRSPIAWIVRKSNEPIRPWNLDEVVDIPRTAEQFVRNLTNKCTYLIGEDVLPKSSLLYSEFLVRNAINALKIDGERLDRNTREALYRDLFVERRKSGRITRKRVVSALRNYGLDVTDQSLGGMDLEIPAQLRSLIDFTKGQILPPLSENEVEEIIEKLTVFPEGGEIVDQWLVTRFGDRLPEEKRALIRSFKYRDWGTFSRKLLTGIWHTSPDMRRMSIMDIMREQSVNLMELLSKENYSFTDQINALNKAMSQISGKITHDHLEDMRLAPPTRKSIWQALRICQELFRIMGGYPDKVFIEMARGEEEKKRKASRKQNLLDLYRNCKQDVKEWHQEMMTPADQMQRRDWTTEISARRENDFKSKKLFLYYMQRGRCMYSGDPISLEDLFDSSKYDIDHIYPRSLTKDDSFSNLVLVRQDLNREKSDRIISEDIQLRCRSFWNSLHQQGLLNQNKYERLTRKEPLSPDELEKFIARQLVVTRQSTKVLADLLKKMTGSPNIVYVKAELASDFRYRDGTRKDALTKFYFPKLRDLNDLHHAKDAYLNIVVGNVYDTKFTRNFKNYLLSNPARSYNLVKFYDQPVSTAKTVAWIPGEQGTIATVNKMMNRNNVLVTYESGRQAGGFFDQMLVKKGLGQHPIRSSSDQEPLAIARYGGYNKVSGSHFCLISHLKKKKRIRTLVSLPIILKASEFSDESVSSYLVGQGYEQVHMIAPEIRYGSIILKNGVAYRILAKTGESIKCASTIQPVFTPELEQRLKHYERYLVHEDRDVAIDEQELNECFLAISQRFSEHPFNRISTLADQGAKLMDARNDFAALDLRGKLKNIFRVLNLLKGGTTLTDMSDLYKKPDGKKTGAQSGMITISINFADSDRIQILNQSVTGFYQNLVEL